MKQYINIPKCISKKYYGWHYRNEFYGYYENYSLFISSPKEPIGIGCDLNFVKDDVIEKTISGLEVLIFLQEEKKNIIKNTSKKYKQKLIPIQNQR